MFLGKINKVIILKKSIKIFMRTVFLTSILLVFFVAFGYMFLSSKVTLAEQKQEKVPYYEPIPQNVSVLLTVLDSKTLFFLDFEKENMRVLSVGEEDGYTFYGYSADFYAECDLNTVSGIIDIIGGIELEINDEKLNYTGTQVKEILEYNTDKTMETEILKKTIEKISKTGFSKEDFLYIIKNSNTNLTVPDCYNWEKYIGKLCKNAIFVN